MRTCKRSLLLVLLMLALLPLDSMAGNGKLNSSLKYLMRQRERALTMPRLKGEMPEAAKPEKVVATVKFDDILSASKIAEYEALGVSFYNIGGGITHTESIYPVRIPWNVIKEISDRAEVLRIESAWRPGRIPTLDVSAGEIEADSVWSNCTDGDGYPVTGKGTRIAVFDTGIDVFHPSFFFADGDTLSWLDENGNEIFDSGIDGVDRNGNGQLNTGERLRFTDGMIYDYARIWGDELLNNLDGIYQTYWDWLYADLNNDGIRNHGPDNGFTEQDPTYGEPCFITLDDNGNGALDPGEMLVALKTSKIYATFNPGGIERIRGVDLIYSAADEIAHGTATSGILIGGTPGRHRFTGIAPDAELLMGDWHTDYVPVSILIPWARSHGADVMLYEWGGLVEEFLDGTSLEEELISIENNSTLQVVPSGNLAHSPKHTVDTVSDLGSTSLQFYNYDLIGGQAIQEIYLTALWRTDISDLTFKLKTPNNSVIEIDGSVEEMEVDGYYVYVDFDTSPKGTCKFDLFVTAGENPSCLGIWYILLKSGVELGTDTKFVCNVSDELSSWENGMRFINIELTGEMSATSPSTADNCFTNGSYSTRGIEVVGDELVVGAMEIGEISSFSGRGPRIDGAPILELCSPGNIDVYTTLVNFAPYYPAGGYMLFSGTSAAGPHVAAGAMLIKQAFPDATVEEISNMLIENAATDEFTGDEYNDDWGFGKLRLFRAVEGEEVKGKKDGNKPHNVSGSLTVDTGRLMLGQNYPNPFNPTTWIPFYIPRSGSISVKVYNVKGELVKVLKEGHMDSGLWSVSWDGTNARGQQVGSGVYFCALSQNGEKQTRKLMLLR